MNVDYVRQVATECDTVVTRLYSGTERDDIQPVLAEAMALLARAAAVLHTAVLPSESHEERSNGSRPVQDTGETPTGQQRTTEGDRHEMELIGHLHCAEHDRDTYRKRWHEAATQRDHLAHAARKVLARGGPTTTALDELEAAVETLDNGEAIPHANADRLRRELWHVLDRMPASDDNLIATVKKLKEQP